MSDLAIQENRPWSHCTYLTCSVLPVFQACNCDCKFCFSKSSISSIKHEKSLLDQIEVAQYYQWAKQNGAKRLVITGGGEPLLKPAMVLQLMKEGSQYFDEITCFTNGTYLTQDLSAKLLDHGLSYLCYSRHHYNDEKNQELMGKSAPALADFMANANGVPIRATCVMTKGFIDTKKEVWNYIDCLSKFGVKQFTFKHTYETYKNSVFKESNQNKWVGTHKVDFNPFKNQGKLINRLPWGPEIREIEGFQVCYYYEPDPSWEKKNKICRSSNLLANGKVYASLEEMQSQLFQLKPSKQPLPQTM